MYLLVKVHCLTAGNNDCYVTPKVCVKHVGNLPM